MNKKIIALGLISLLGAGLAIGLGAKTSGVFAEHRHTGNHYAAVEATLTEAGVKEYWVCCGCNEHFFEQPEGTWAEGTHSHDFTVDVADDRYVPAKLADEGFTFKTTDDGEVVITGLADGTTVADFTNDGSIDIKIPDGVTKVENLGDIFNNKDLGTVIIPASVKDLGEGKNNLFYGVRDVKNVVYQGNFGDFVPDMFKDMIEACLKSYKDNTFQAQPYVPTNLWLGGNRYVTSSKVIGDYINISGKTSSGYVFYYKDEVPAKMTTAKGKSYSIDICGKDTKKLNAAFGLDNHEAFINQDNL